MTKINQNSNYWSGNLSGSNNMWWREEAETPKGKDLIALAGYRRAISNFVNIVTQRSDIPVTFNSNDSSFTTGKKVVLSANITDNNFDPSVGLALHEGSHIVHSDFELLRDLPRELANRMDIDRGGLVYNSPEYTDFYDMTDRVKNLLNYVEDRRIDYLTFKAAPGYKNYYHSMYNKYFNFRVITKALKSNEHRDPSSYESYEFRIINFTNEATDLNALPGLREIYRELNLKSIDRLKSTEDSLKVAIKMYQIIKENLVVKTEQVQEDDQQQQESNSESGDNGEEATGNNNNTPQEQKQEATEAANGEEESASSEGVEFDRPELSDNEKKTLEKSIKKQKTLIDGDTRKTKLSKRDSQQLKSVEESQAYQEEVGSAELGGKTKCIVIPRITQSMIPTGYSKTYNFLSKSPGYYSSVEYEEAILDGLRLGTILGKKLQVRNEERALKWTRQDSGRIDRRLISELGFGNSNVFQTTLIEKYDDAYLHISIDASGSMNGTPFANSLKSAAAVCKAASMTGNIHVQVTIRTSEKESPLMAVVYDSKVNKIVHIKKFWKHLDCTGITPEGLCFEALEKQILSDSNGRDAYFLNLSDGMPYFANNEISYSGREAAKHTSLEVDKFRKAGIKILSFFITEGRYRDEHNLETFKRMYGKDAVTIDPTNVVSLAKVLNAKFLEA